MIFFQEHSFCYVQINFYNGIVFHLAFSNASVRARNATRKTSTSMSVKLCKSYYSTPINDYVNEEKCFTIVTFMNSKF